MKKLLFIILTIIVVCSLIVGCGKGEVKRHVKYDVKVFDTEMEQHIYVDKETGVQYIYVDGHNRAGFSVRLDANGKPMIAPLKKVTE